jgi:hypothetical protein
MPITRVEMVMVRKRRKRFSFSSALSLASVFLREKSVTRTPVIFSAEGWHEKHS